MYLHLKHSTVKIEDLGKVIYVDPYMIDKSYSDADYIFITHSHYDHYSEDDIQKVMSENTTFIITKDLVEKVEKFEKKYIIVQPNEKYNLDGISFETIPAYNVNKVFHKKEYNWVGYIIKINEIRYYIAGDTDITDEAKRVQTDIAFIPVGGTYTMNSKEAAELTNIIKPKIAIPIHYGVIVGTKDDAISFKNSLDIKVKCEII